MEKDTDPAMARAARQAGAITRDFSHRLTSKYLDGQEQNGGNLDVRPVPDLIANLRNELLDAYAYLVHLAVRFEGEERFVDPIGWLGADRTSTAAEEAKKTDAAGEEKAPQPADDWRAVPPIRIPPDLAKVNADVQMHAGQIVQLITDVGKLREEVFGKDGEEPVREVARQTQLRLDEDFAQRRLNRRNPDVAELMERLKKVEEKLEAVCAVVAQAGQLLQDRGGE